MFSVFDVLRGLSTKAKRGGLLVLLAALLAIVLAPVTSFAAGGTGTADDPYIIETADELAQLATEVNTGTSTSGVHYKLGADIDLSSFGNWVPIANASNRAFRGVFDGDGHTISGLTLGKSNGYGLFGWSRGTVTNFTIVAATMSAPYTDQAGAGVVVGYNMEGGTVSNITSTSTITCDTGNNGAAGLGGIVGRNDGTVDYCFNYGSITNTYNARQRIGGIVGFNYSTVRNCGNFASITSNGNNVGGITGHNTNVNTSLHPLVENCFNWGAMQGFAQVGGISGTNNNGTVQNCYNAGTTTGTNGFDAAGSIVRSNVNGTTKDSYGVVGGSDNSTSNLIGYASGTTSNNNKVQNSETDLQTMCDNLNSWSGFTEGTHKKWYYGDGRKYPTFDPILVTLTFKAGDHGDFGKDDSDAPITTVSKDVEYGAAWDNSWVPTPTPAAGYSFAAWNPAPFPTTVTENAEFTATWTANTNTPYKVEYYYQVDGSYPTAATSSVERTGTTDTTAEVTAEDKTPDSAKTGYVFDSANTNNVLSGTITGDGKLVLKVYFKQQFTVVYEPGDKGTWDATDDTHTGNDYGAETPDPNNDPESDDNHAAGYSFGGWTPSKADTVTKNVNYVAQWTANEDTPYKVEYYFQENGSYPATTTDYVMRSGTTDTTVETTDADKQTAKAGYVFDEAASNVLSGTIAGDGSLVLKVYFKQQFTVVYAPGTQGTWTAGDNTHSGVEYGSATPASSYDPELDDNHKPGYHFVGWDPEVAETVADDATYTAMWEINTYTITWVDEDGTVLATTTVEYGETPAYDGETPTKPETETATYSFAGWDPEVVAATEDATYTATYTETPKPKPEPEMFTITFDPNGGNWDGDTTPIAVDYSEGEEIIIIDAPVREGYEFDYWQGSEYQPGDKYTVTEEHTFTAVWKAVTPTPEPATHTITFKLDGGSWNGVTQDIAIEYDEGTVLIFTDDVPSKNGYTFEGWKDSAGKVYKIDDTFTVSSDETFTAQWKATPAPAPKPAPKPATPATGDVVAFGSMAVLAAAGLVSLAAARVTRKED